MTQPNNSNNIITYKNKANIEKKAKKQAKKIDIKKVFRDGGVAGVISALGAHQGIIKLIVPLTTYGNGNLQFNLGAMYNELIRSGNDLGAWFIELVSKGSNTTIALLQGIALNPTLAATAIGLLAGAGGILISATTRLIASKKGKADTFKKKHTR